MRIGEHGERRLLVSVVPPEQFERVLATLFDENAFLSPHGLRSVSKRHSVPYSVPGIPGAVIEYEPAESRSQMYGGNSNWRRTGVVPDELPRDPFALAVRPLLRERLHGRISDPVGEASHVRGIAADLSDRLVSIWLPDAEGHRPVYGGMDKFQHDPAWRNNLLFHEYFHGDNGAGLGASHQTGWTALVADLIIDPPGESTFELGGLDEPQI